MDPYKILGVNQNATQEEIKTAYRSLVKKYHPDKYADHPLGDLAEEKMQQINQAYDMLTGTNGSRGQGQYKSSAGNQTATFAMVRDLINTGIT